MRKEKTTTSESTLKKSEGFTEAPIAEISDTKSDKFRKTSKRVE